MCQVAPWAEGRQDPTLAGNSSPLKLIVGIIVADPVMEAVS